MLTLWLIFCGAATFGSIAGQTVGDRIGMPASIGAFVAAVISIALMLWTA